jgi:hypothetical protein
VFEKDLTTGRVKRLIEGEGSIYTGDPPPVYGYVLGADGDFWATRGTNEILRYDSETLTPKVVFANPNPRQLLTLITPLADDAPPAAVPLPPPAAAAIVVIPVLVRAWKSRRARSA